MNIAPQQRSAEEKMDTILEWPMIFLTAMLIPIMAIPFLFSLSPAWLNVFSYSDTTIWVIFYLELFLKLLVSNNRLRTLKKNWLLVIILLIPILRVFRLVRFARVLRLTRLLRLQSLVDHLRKNTRLLVINVEYGLLIFLTVVLISSFLIWQVEQNAAGTIQSLGDALWWSVTTITTIGYGDIVPVTQTGKIIGSVVAFTGVIIFMVITAKIASIFTRGRIEASHDELLKKLLKQIEKLEKKEK